MQDLLRCAPNRTSPLAEAQRLISSRVGAAIAVVLSIAALAFAVVAFMSTIRDDSKPAGRLVQSRLTNEYNGAPIYFPLDQFYVGRDSQGRIRAFYVYPPGYFGHTRGCKVVWDSAAVIDTEKGTFGPGLYVEPCSGARFNRDGELIYAPADRGLDYFATQAAVEGVIVDTRKLYCGPDYVQLPTSTPAPATATVQAATAVVERLTATPVTPSPTVEGTPTPRACETVSPDSK